jgi:hypothetical protein
MRTLVADIGRQGPALVALGCPRRCRLEVIERMADHFADCGEPRMPGGFHFHRYQVYSVVFVGVRTRSALACFGAGEVVDFCTDPYAEVLGTLHVVEEGRRTGFFTPRPPQHLLLSWIAAACVLGRLGTLPGAAWPSDPAAATRPHPIPSPRALPPTDPKLFPDHTRFQFCLALHAVSPILDGELATGARLRDRAPR